MAPLYPWHQQQQHNALPVMSTAHLRDLHLVHQYEKTRTVSDELQRARISLLAWKAVAALLAVVLVFQFYAAPPNMNTYSTGWATDLEDARPFISLEQRRFTGAMYFDRMSGNVSLALSDGEPQYVGGPSTMVDAAWNSLIGNPFFSLVDSEMEAPLPSTSAGANDDAYESYPDLVIQLERRNDEKRPAQYGSMSMSYQLQCLNTMRKLLEIGSDAFETHLQQLSVSHCIDTIRQGIMCHGDTTLMSVSPLYGVDGEVVMVGNADHTHTCRNAQKLLDYSHIRAAQPGRLST